jgi:hypothetical protein
LALPFSAANAAMPTAAPLPAARLDQEMAQVPASDPSTPDAPKLVDAMKGVHPRLLFTQAEIDALKAKVGSDPILQQAYDQVKQWATMTPALTGPRPLVVAGDDMMGTYYLKAPNLAYTYALEKDPAAKQKIIDTLTTMLNTDHWADANNEVDASMGAAQNLFFVSLLYDTVYNDLDPDLRSKLAQKIFTMARRMYYLGHKQLELPFGGKGFWNADPQPNHRWYRDMGLAAATLVTCDEQGIDAGYLMQGLKDETDFVMKWYPPDGDCHEGAGYQEYGFLPIVTFCTMMDRNVGTTYLKNSGLKDAWVQHIHWWLPGRLSDISWGDDQNSPGKPGSFPAGEGAFFACSKISGDKDAQAALQYFYNKQTGGQPPSMPWPILQYYDPSITGGDMKNIPTHQLLPDIGAASMRDSWDDTAVVFTFKCGPYGGYKLNEYRNTVLDNGKPHYLNLAHDDPDANEFDLAVGGGFAFHPGNYTSPDHSKKLSGEHSTITVDGKGQVGEGGGFSQPVGDYDQTQFSYLTGWKADDKGHIMIEGEAGNAYRGMDYPEMKAAGGKLPDPVLKSYRRTAIWMPKEYILILDNIAANGTHQITWHGTATQATDENGTGVVSTEKGDQVGIQTVSNQTFTSKVQPMTLVGRWGNDPIQQIQLDASADAVKFATVLDPWKTGAKVKLSGNTVEVTGQGFDDTWTWNDPKDANTPSNISGSRGSAAIIALTDADKAPHGDSK